MAFLERLPLRPAPPLLLLVLPLLLLLAPRLPDVDFLFKADGAATLLWLFFFFFVFALRLTEVEPPADGPFPLCLALERPPDSPPPCLLYTSPSPRDRG